ncbi:hypothetical protein [Nitrospira sp. Ecomares 2.1]
MQLSLMRLAIFTTMVMGKERNIPTGPHTYLQNTKDRNTTPSPKTLRTTPNIASGDAIIMARKIDTIRGARIGSAVRIPSTTMTNVGGVSKNGPIGRWVEVSG